MAAQHASTTEAMNANQDGYYHLRTLIDNIPLKEDAESEDEVYITTVDAWDGNLYVGTSAAELLHFVSIPAEDASESPTYILASRQSIEYDREQAGPDKGVKQILILPGAGKACILCNSTLTFYTLPELSPAFGDRIKQSACSWVGGLDLSDDNASTSPVIMLCLKARLRLIRIGEEARKIRDIELKSVDAVQRRADLACVSDGTTYSLVDVVNQRKNELFPIASTSEAVTPQRNQDLAPTNPSHHQTRSLTGASPIRLGRGHVRNVSSQGSSAGDPRLRPDDGSAWPPRGSSQALTSTQSPRRQIDASPSGTRSETPPPPPAKDPITYRLPANIASPSAEEFLLTTGTRLSEPGVGLFVNFEGDVVRGTVEFSSYPDLLLLDQVRQEDAENYQRAPDSYILALVRRPLSDGAYQSIVEVQQLGNADDGRSPKQYLQIPQSNDGMKADDTCSGVGLRHATTRAVLATNVASQVLVQRRLRILDEEAESDSEESRNRQEDEFAARFASVSSDILLFSGAQVSWTIRTSLVTRLHAKLDQAVVITSDNTFGVDAKAVQFVLNSIRGQQAENELEFVTLTYVRQRGSLLLFSKLLESGKERNMTNEHLTQIGSALQEADVDPRILLSLFSDFKHDVKVQDEGLWVSRGLVETYQQMRKRAAAVKIKDNEALLEVLKSYLMFWRSKKGFGSVADEASVFFSVDSALIHILLVLDGGSPRGRAIEGSVRSEMNEVIDKGVDCFDRAIELFTQHHRLYMLSRLYQSRKMSLQVLACWRRIVEGERDDGGELIEGEIEIRRYLGRIRDKNLVTEYGTWLANRNAKLGAQVFADESSKVKYSPTEAVDLLKEKAPGAVKEYLEFLVFGKNHTQYVNDLISFYLSTVLSEIDDENSSSSATLLQTTETYRALRPPKPTFSDFIMDNAISAEWWSNRMRLLQLIGGSHGAASQYDVNALRTKLEPHRKLLVPEMIILNGREGKHSEAIHLLVAGLGDYDTAIRYCLLGGSSIFHPPSATAAERPPIPSREEQAQLFAQLLHEFLSITDDEEQLERTSELLERFGGWFDIDKVLDLLPTDWPVHVLIGFLIPALRRLVGEKNESSVAKALAGAQNLRTSEAFIEKLADLKPVIDLGAEIETE